MFWIFIIVLAIFLPLLFVMRNRMLAWGWNFAVMAILLYCALYKTTGTPRDAWLFSTIEGVHGPVQVVYSTTTKDSIYLLIRQESGVPFYVKIPVVKETEDDLKKAKMEADQNQSEVMADADMLSRWSVKLGQKKSDNQESKGTSAETADRKEPNSEKKENAGGMKEGGKKMFYPKPVQTDPLKFHSITIEPPLPEITAPQ